MKLTFHLDATFFDCILRIRCENGFNVAYRMTSQAGAGTSTVTVSMRLLPRGAVAVMR